MPPIVGAPTPADIPEPITITGMRPRDMLRSNSSTACLRSIAMLRRDYLSASTAKPTSDVNFGKASQRFDVWAHAFFQSEPSHVDRYGLLPNSMPIFRSFHLS